MLRKTNTFFSAPSSLLTKKSSSMVMMSFPSIGNSRFFPTSTNAAATTTMSNTSSTSVLSSSKRFFFASSSPRFFSANTTRAQEEATSAFSKSENSNHFNDDDEEANGAKDKSSKTSFLDQLSTPARSVSRWLLVCAGVVFCIICVGGITRLTESGLSIVEWRPVAGMVPPLTKQQWEAEFAKYQKYPEYSQNPDMDLKHFKFIFFWEWFHRVLARSVGMVFLFPLLYYSGRGYFNNKRMVQAALFGMFCLGGAQGALGWYMVKSGLDPKLVEERRKATVSSYRLAAHLSLALVLYASMIRLAFAMRITPRLELSAALKSNLWDLRLLGRGLFGSLSLTVLTGAFVAGLDAGLLFNDEFPWMFGGWLPPAEEVYKIVPFWRNFSENPVAAQAIHRLLAGMTLYFVICLNLMVYYKSQRMGRDFLPTHITKAVNGINHTIAFQILLGILTVAWSVPIPVAALHQANAVVALTMVIRMLTFVSKRGAVRI